MLIFAPSVSMSGEGSDLKEIMQGLRNNLVDISDGLLTDDFEKIAHGADAIAGHPQIPPSQVKLVAAELGSEMATFKQLDTLVHDLSLEITAAATTHDRDDAISGYQRLLEGCLACHGSYKERVAAVLIRTPAAESPAAE
jgi:hypothetical protein